jgi:hypothetical protein
MFRVISVDRFFIAECLSNSLDKTAKLTAGGPKETKPLTTKGVSS